MKSNPIFDFPVPVFPIQYATFTELSLTIRGVSYSLPCKMIALGLKKNIVVSGNMDKNRVGRSVFFTMVLISTLSYYTRFCLCCLLVTLYFDMFCYRKNDLDMMISSWN